MNVFKDFISTKIETEAECSFLFRLLVCRPVVEQQSQQQVAFARLGVGERCLR